MDWTWLGPLPGTTMLFWVMVALLTVTLGSWLLSRWTDPTRKEDRRRARDERRGRYDSGDEDELERRRRRHG